MIGQSMHGFVENKELEIDDIDVALREPTDKRIFIISKAMHKGYTIDQIHDLTKIDKWFLEKLKHIIDIDEQMKALKSVNNLDKELLRTAKVYGFTDFQIARASDWSLKSAICTRPCLQSVSCVRIMASFRL